MYRTVGLKTQRSYLVELKHAGQFAGVSVMVRSPKNGPFGHVLPITNQGGGPVGIIHSPAMVELRGRVNINETASGIYSSSRGFIEKK